MGNGLDWHLQRAAEISRSALGEPVDVDAGRPLREVVEDVLARTGWLGMGSVPVGCADVRHTAPTDVTLRPERTDDHDVISELITSAFAGKPYAEGDEADLLVALRRAGALTLSLVAELDGAVVGQAAFSPARASDGAPGWYALGPVAVLPAHQGKGIGSRLVRAGLDHLADRGAAGCILVGDAAYYTRFGFRVSSEDAPAGQPADCFMLKLLGERQPEGPIFFHSAFGGGG